MASADDYAGWIVKNQALKGTPEFDTVAAAYQQAKAETQPVQPSVSPEGSAMAAEGMGIPETLAVGAGRGFDKLAMGLKQAVLTGAKNYGPESMRPGIEKELADTAATEAEKDQAYAGLREKRPVSTGAGEAVPSIMATGGAGMVPAALTTAGMEALKYGTPEERMKNALVGGASSAVGTAASNAIGRTIAPVAKSAFNSTKSEALRIATALGIKPRLSEVTNSPFIARMEDLAAQTPGGQGVMQDFAQANQKAVNRTAATAIGETADELSPQVLSAASGRLGKVFEDIKSLPGKTIAITKPVGDAADEIIRIQGKMIPAEQDAALLSLAKNAKALAENGGKIDGETYQLIRSGLSSQSFDANGTNKALYGKLLEAVDNAAEQSLNSTGNKELAQALRSARPQYGNLMTLEKGLVAEGGNVSPARLASALRAKNPKAFREGAEGPLYDIGRVGESMKPLKEGSQTYGREAASDVLSSIIKAPLAYGVAKATTSPVMTAIPRMVASNPTANLVANSLAEGAKPATRALTQAQIRALIDRLVLPVSAEQQ